MKKQSTSLFSAAVIVAALGYFVDIYDLLLFSIVRVESLRDIGLNGRELEFGAVLSNIQMTGLMLGGILWGVLGDKRGRLSVLFGSIFLYSLANFLNGFATTFTEYAFCRFFAGLGLAGELGAGITLVSEILPANKRGYGTMIVATVGVSGAIVGGWVAQIFDWRTAFKIGGALGFLLFFLRVGVSESGIFEKVRQSAIKRGNFFQLFTSLSRFRRFAFCILAGAPIWFTIGILVSYSPEFARQLGITEEVSAGKAIMYAYGGFVIGDFLSGMMSQWLKSRNLALRWFVAFNFAAILVYLYWLPGRSAADLYLVCLILGTTGGYWAVIISMAAEQFGTNLRATVATTVPNFIRFSLVPMNFIFLSFNKEMPFLESAIIVGAGASLTAFFAAFQLDETFGRDLGFNEEV